MTGARLTRTALLAVAALLAAACIKFDDPVVTQVSSRDSHQVQQMAVADVTGDGPVEVIVLTSQNELVVFTSCGGSCLTELQRLTVDATSFTSGDFDSDGHADVVYVGSTGATFLPGATDGFSTAGQSAFATDRAPFLAGDFNGDGNLDLVGSQVIQVALYVIVQILEGDGAGGFVPGQILLDFFPAPGFYFDPAHPDASNYSSADTDGDGDDELIVSWANPTVNPPTTLTWVFQGDGTYQTLPDWAMASGDIDGDGRADLATYRSGEVVFVQSTPSGWVDFPDGQGFEVELLETGALRDFEGDGVTDFAMANLWASGTANGRFGTVAFSFPPGFDRTTAFGDTDGDGLDDVVIDTDGMFAEFELHRNGSTVPAD